MHGDVADCEESFFSGEGWDQPPPDYGSTPAPGSIKLQCFLSKVTFYVDYSLNTIKNGSTKTIKGLNLERKYKTKAMH